MDRKISLTITDVSNKSWNFEGLRELHDFILTEAEYWKEKQDAVSASNNQLHPYINTHATLNHIANTIDSWEPNLKEWNEATFTQQLQNLKHSHINGLRNNWIWSGHPYASVLVECNKKYNNKTAASFTDFILKKQVTNINDSDHFLGAMLAYEYLNQDSDLTKRRNGEKVSLGHLRSQLEETTRHLVNEVEDFKGNFTEWDNTTKENWNTWLSDTSTEHETSQSTRNDEFRKYLDDCKTRISDLEHTYQEKLRLEKPATYWKKSAKKYGVQGGLWSLALIASLILGVYYFSDFFTTWLAGKETDVKLSTIQGIILFGSILAIYAFLVKALSRLTFSSFHLMRDSEEREQLTYLYLALNNDKNIDEKSRDIILQALFSRSETGLLASETGPKMPGITELLKSVPRK